jgi:lysophospholipase L1-like esterase
MLPQKASLLIVCLGFWLAVVPTLPGGGSFRKYLAEAFSSLPDLPVPPAPKLLPAEVNMRSPAANIYIRSGPGIHLHQLDGLAAFYNSLELTEQKVCRTRILHYGDSPTTADMVTDDVRQHMQKRFGDAGHGFVLIDKPWDWYAHAGIEMQAAGWTTKTATTVLASDQKYGLGGATFVGALGSFAHFKIAPRYRRVQLSYLQQVGGGLVQIEANSVPISSINTGLGSGWTEARLPIGKTTNATVTVRGAGGVIRLFGLTFLTDDVVGVVYDSLGLNGASTQTITNFFQEEHWGQHLRQATPHLVVINYGSNDSVSEEYVDGQFAKDLQRAIDKVRRTVPTASILVMSPMDKGRRSVSGGIETSAALNRLVQVQRRVAKQENCAFFDTFQAMGGSGTMARWYNQTPKLVNADFLHPTAPGAATVGKLLFDGLMEGFKEYKSRRTLAKAQITGIAKTDAEGAQPR